jgi:putative flippase GtrA
MASVTSTIAGGRGREIGAFALVGLLNTALDFAILNGLIALTHQDRGAWLFGFDLLAFAVGMGNSYLLNASVTFRQRTGTSVGRIGRFAAVSLVGLLINGAVVLLLRAIAPHALPALVAVNGGKLVATGASLCWNYLALRRWVFTGGQTAKSPSAGGETVQFVK